MYLGLDPATTTGYAVVDPEGNVELSGTIRAPKQYKKELAWIWQTIDLDLTLKGHFGRSVSDKFSAAAIETVFSRINPKTTIMLAELGMAWKTSLLRLEVPIYLVNNKQLKKFVGVSGKDNSKKEKLRAKVKELYGFEAKTSDEVEGFVLAQIARGAKNLNTLLNEEQQDVVMSIEKIVTHENDRLMYYLRD